MIDLKHADLIDAMRYDPDTGHFWWRKKTSPSANLSRPMGFSGIDGYWFIHFRRTQWRAHRLAWFYVHGEWPRPFLDHINGDRQDNRLCNLRLANNAQNMMNASGSQTSTSGVKGVSWCARANKWRACLKTGGRFTSLGYYATIEAAKIAYETAAAETFGCFAHHLNNRGKNPV